MKIIVNDSIYINCDRTQYTIINKKTNSEGKDVEINLGYYGNLKNAIKRAYYILKIVGREKTIEEIESKLDEGIERFCTNFKIDDILEEIQRLENENRELKKELEKCSVKSI